MPLTPRPLAQKPRQLRHSRSPQPRQLGQLDAVLAEHPKSRSAVTQLDIDSPESIKNAAAEVSKLLPEGLDAFIGNAGVNHQQKPTFEELYVLFIPKFSLL